jgi:hypothetical protein
MVRAIGCPDNLNDTGLEEKECHRRLLTAVQPNCGSHLLHIGEVVEIHVEKSCVKDGKPDIATINPIIYAQATYFGVGKVVEAAFSAGKKYRKK